MDRERPEFELNLYAHRVTWAIVIICGLLFIAGLRITGVDFNKIKRQGQIFDSDRHVCVKTEWLRVSTAGMGEIRLCVEWIDPEDRSGNIHRINLGDLEVGHNSKGELQARYREEINYPLVGVIIYLIALTLFGKWLQWVLIRKRRGKLGLQRGNR